MSRCFPFPPPGYEKKTRTDDTNLLKKEKHREKKHKKEKKDKEKREDKAKREKDRSDGKHRDKKDRKEKHRDKKDKEKDRDKDKDKSCMSEEKRISGEFEIDNGEKKLNRKEREWDKGKSGMSNEKKGGHIGEKPIQSNLLYEGAGDSKFVQELCRRIRDEEKGTRSQLVEGFGIRAEGRENTMGKRVDDRKIDGQGIRDDGRTSGSTVVQNFAGMVQNRVGGMPKLLEKNAERRVEEKDKSKEREGDKKRGDKQKNTDTEKKSHGKDKDREKEKKKEEKVKEKREHNKNKEQGKLEDRNGNDLLGTLSTGFPLVSEDGGERNAASEGNLKKRKDFGMNGFLHETDIRPSKMQRPSLRPSTENGRKLEPCQTTILSTLYRQGPVPPNNLRVDNKEHKVNGVIKAQSSPISPKKTSATAQSDQVAQVSMKPMLPHPDSKYLSQLLSVPKMEEWSDFDDQEWLLSSKGISSEKKPDVGSVVVPETPRVWAQALQIESADVCALPYVIPY